MTHVAVLALALLAQTAGSPPRAAAPQTPWAERTLKLPIVGTGVAYVPRTPTTRVALFLSGDGGWNLGVVDMARRLADKAIIIGLSYPALRKATSGNAACWYSAGDLEVISQAAQKQLGLPEYQPPLLIGYSSGATLVYAALAAAPPTTFVGGLSLGFCPDLPVDRPVCSAGDWRPSFDPKKHESLLPITSRLSREWYILQGIQDQVCAFDDTKAFLDKVPRSHLVRIEGTGHGFGRPIRWGTPFDESAEAIWRESERPAPPPAPPAPAVRALESGYAGLDLPLVYRWTDAPRAFLVFVSGDGGWAALDEGIAQAVTDSGVAVVGLNSLRYFWREKTVSQFATDLQRVVAPLEGRGVPVFAGGYSFGASVLPVALEEWPATARRSVSGLVLISPSSTATFEIDPLDWIRTAEDSTGARVTPALRSLGLQTLCIAGTDESDGACLERNAADLLHLVRLPGSHHYHGDYARLGRVVRDFIDGTLQVRSRTPAY